MIIRLTAIIALKFLMISSASMRTRASKIGFILLLTLSCEATASSWVHEVSDAANPRAGTFRIRTVAQEDDHLIGSATYHEVGRNVVVEIEGVETLDGRFWPKAVVEGANDVNGPWEPLDQLSVSGRPVTLSFEFAEANPFLYFNLDALKPAMTKMRYGRIILPNGADTVFELTEILPTKAAKDGIEEDWQLNIQMGYLSNPIGQGPFFVGAIAFSEGHLRAEAGYLDPKATSAVVIEGTKTSKKYSSEEDFWASAILEVANDPKGPWKTLGQAATPGKSATITIHPNEKSITSLNIRVDILRPTIGKFGYGRAVLSNGKSATFELINLLPPSGRR